MLREKSIYVDRGRLCSYDERQRMETLTDLEAAMRTAHDKHEPPAGTQRRYVGTTWEVWTYDVWGNATDGYEVNDRYCHERAHGMSLIIDTYNKGTSAEFESASPSDSQIRKVFGVKCQIDTDGDDLTIYVNRERDGYPIGELHCTSHESLSPVRLKAETTSVR